MAPKSSLPLHSCWTDENDFIESVLRFAASDDIFRNLCGGIHILDFLTRKPALYTTVLPSDWRRWVEDVHVDDFLDLLLRENLDSLAEALQSNDGPDAKTQWRNYQPPPQSLVAYILTIRKFCLRRDAQASGPTHHPLPRHLVVGMKPKKVHEVMNFASFVHRLAAEVQCLRREPVTDVIDFGSGQNYLGRILASPPYHMHVTAIERRHHNISGAKGMDVSAKLAKKTKVLRNKKAYKRQMQTKAESVDAAAGVWLQEADTEPSMIATDESAAGVQSGSVTYIEHELEDGKLEHIISRRPNITGRKANAMLEAPGNRFQLKSGMASDQHNQSMQKSFSAVGSLTYSTPPNSMVVSLHSCGNLVHHGLQSLTLNPSVSAVAMIGCCYNLMTERLGPATYKLPILRPYHPRLQSTSEAHDPHGFPMSKKFETFEYKSGQGLRLNITARMMAVQAPYNWGPEDSQAFFTRHFFRALLQRILLDHGVVQQPDELDSLAGGSLSGIEACETPLIVGSLRKSCFTSFSAYLRGALAKLAENPDYGSKVKEGTANLTEDVIASYEKDFQSERKHLSVIWSLMAFSAGVVESLIAVDRWSFLREQECVERCWVESVFDYAQSPRNLVVVGIKKGGASR